MPQGRPLHLVVCLGACCGLLALGCGGDGPARLEPSGADGDADGVVGAETLEAGAEDADAGLSDLDAAADTQGSDLGAPDAAALNDVAGDSAASDAPIDAAPLQPQTGLLHPPPAWLKECLAGPAIAPTLLLRWSPFYAGETAARVRQGVLWNLQLIGAQLPAAQAQAIAAWVDTRRLRVDLHAAGFDKRARCLLQRIVAVLQQSEESSRFGAIDAGRFAMATVGAATHYYALTDAAPTLAAFRARHLPFVEAAEVEVSGIAVGARRLQRVDAKTWSQIAWMAREQAPKGQLAEHETIDVMANGELRFAIYWPDGHLSASADPALGAAGKPARCMFCHESRLSPVFTPHAFGESPTEPDGQQLLDRAAFLRRVKGDNAQLWQFRLSEPRLVEHRIRDQHSQGELLIVGFLEPSFARLVSEWAVPEAMVAWLTKGLPTHHEAVYHVDPALCFDRADVDSRSPYQVAKVPSSQHFDVGDEIDWLSAAGP